MTNKLKDQISNFPLTFPDQSTNELTIFNGGNNDHWLIILPAMGIRASYYFKFAKTLSKYGKMVVTVDYRGVGNSSVRPSRKTNFGFTDWLRDLDFTINIIKNLSVKAKIVLVGHSIGGQLACLYYSRHPDNIEKIYLIGSGLPFYKIWKGWGKLKLLAGGIIAPILAKIVGYFPGDITGFAGKESIGCMIDWSHVVMTGNYKLQNDHFNYESNMQKISPVITAISFPEDNLAPPYTVTYLLNKFQPNTNINHHILPGFNHFNWTRNVTPFVKKFNTL